MFKEAAQNNLASEHHWVCSIIEPFSVGRGPQIRTGTPPPSSHTNTISHRPFSLSKGEGVVKSRGKWVSTRPLDTVQHPQSPRFQGKGIRLRMHVMDGDDQVFQQDEPQHRLVRAAGEVGLDNQRRELGQCAHTSVQHEAGSHAHVHAAKSQSPATIGQSGV